jgi:hypothetical protein
MNASGEGRGQAVGRLPAGAVAGDEPLDAEVVEGGDGRLDDRLEDGPGQVQAADEAGDLVAAGQAPGVAQDVDRAGMGAGRHHHQALAGDVDDQVLVVQDQRVGLPAVAGPRLVDGEADLELGDPGDLARDQHLVVEQQGRAALLDHLQVLGLQVNPAGLRRPPDSTVTRAEKPCSATSWSWSKWS